MTRFLHGVAVRGALLSLTTSADACPVCDAETGRQVRAGLFDEGLGWNLLATLLPFAVLLGITAAIHTGWPGRRTAAREPRVGSSPQTG